MDTYPIDTYRDSFKAFLASGLTHMEALREFDEEAFQRATLAEIEERRSDVTSDQNSLLSLMAAALREEQDETDMEQATSLWLAGWTSENPSGSNVAVMSWYWRRPPRRVGNPGRLFRSTNQAYRAMLKESA